MNFTSYFNIHFSNSIFCTDFAFIPVVKSEDWGWLEEHGFGLSLWDEQPAFGED